MPPRYKSNTRIPNAKQRAFVRTHTYHARTAITGSADPSRAKEKQGIYKSNQTNLEHESFMLKEKAKARCGTASIISDDNGVASQSKSSRIRKEFPGRPCNPRRMIESQRPRTRSRWMNENLVDLFGELFASNKYPADQHNTHDAI